MQGPAADGADAEDGSAPPGENAGGTTLFFSSERQQLGQHKIYSAVQQDAEWGPASPVDELNMPGASDARPSVRKDGLEIVFDATRFGLPSQIYTATRSSMLEPWSPAGTGRRSPERDDGTESGLDLPGRDAPLLRLGQGERPRRPGRRHLRLDAFRPWLEIIDTTRRRWTNGSVIRELH